jgi:hypothetical protein
VLTRRARASTRTAGTLTRPVRTLVPPVRSRVRPVRTLVFPVRACVGGVRKLAPSVRSRSPSVRKPIGRVRSRIGRVRTQGSDASGRVSEDLFAARTDPLERWPRGWSKHNRIKDVREIGTTVGATDFRSRPRVRRLRPDASDRRPDANVTRPMCERYAPGRSSSEEKRPGGGGDGRRFPPPWEGGGWDRGRLGGGRLDWARRLHPYGAGASPRCSAFHRIAVRMRFLPLG